MASRALQSSLNDRGVPWHCIPSLQSHREALEQDCSLSGVLCNRGDVPTDFLCHLYSHVMLCTNCLGSKRQMFHFYCFYFDGIRSWTKAELVVIVSDLSELQLIIIIIITTLFLSNRYEAQQVHIIYTEPVLARRPEQPVTNNKV